MLYTATYCFTPLRVFMCIFRHHNIAMFSKLIIATTLLLTAGTAQADGPLTAWLNALRTEQNIHNAEQWIGNFAEVSKLCKRCSLLTDLDAVCSLNSVAFLSVVYVFSVRSPYFPKWQKFSNFPDAIIQNEVSAMFGKLLEINWFPSSLISLNVGVCCHQEKQHKRTVQRFSCFWKVHPGAKPFAQCSRCIRCLISPFSTFSLFCSVRSYHFLKWKIFPLFPLICCFCSVRSY